MCVLQLLRDLMSFRMIVWDSIWLLKIFCESTWVPMSVKAFAWFPHMFFRLNFISNDLFRISHVFLMIVYDCIWIHRIVCEFIQHSLRLFRHFIWFRLILQDLVFCSWDVFDDFTWFRMIIQDCMWFSEDFPKQLLNPVSKDPQVGRQRTGSVR